jgi:chemotaxis methyl-accepting protein methylase
VQDRLRSRLSVTHRHVGPNEAALERARAGLYVDNIALDVSAERLRRFFVKSNGHYQISKAVRDLCVGLEA